MADDGISLPEHTDWTQWNFSQVLFALTGDELDLRTKLNGNWLTFDEGTSTVTRTQGESSGHDISYGAFDTYYYLVDYNEAELTGWTGFVDKITTVIDELNKGFRGMLDVESLNRARDKVVEYQNWINDSAADYRAWASNLESEDSGVSGKAGAVIQLRMKQNAEKLENLRHQVEGNDGMPVATALRDVYDAMRRAIGILCSGWYTFVPTLRELPSNKSGIIVDELQSHLRNSGVARDPWIDDADNELYALDGKSKEDAEAMVVDALGYYDRGDPSIKETWTRINDDVSNTMASVLDDLDVSAREAMKVLHPVMLTATSAMTELTDPKSDSKPPTGGFGGGGPVPPPGGGGTEEKLPPDWKKIFDKPEDGPDGGPDDAPEKDPKAPGPDPKDPGGGPEIDDPRKHLEDIVNRGPDGGPKEQPGADEHGPGGGPDGGQAANIPPVLWPGAAPNRPRPADPEKRAADGNPVPEFDSGGNPIPVPGPDENPSDPDAGFDGGFGPAPDSDGNPLPGLGSDGNPLPDPDGETDGEFAPQPGSDGSRPPGLGSGGNPLPDTGGSPDADFATSGGSIGDSMREAPADPDAGFDFGGDTAGSGENGGGQPGISRGTGSGPGGLPNSGEFTPPLPRHQTQLDGTPSTGMGGGMPMMPPMMGGMGGMGGQGNDRQERERQTWLSEDEDVWGTDEKTGFNVIGRPGEADYGLDEEVLSGPVRGPRQTPDKQAERETTNETTASGQA